MSIENKVPMSDFTEVTDIADTARIIGLQDNENVKIPLQSLIAKTLSRVDEDILTVNDINIEGGVTGFNPIGQVVEGDKRAVSGENVNIAFNKIGIDFIDVGNVNIVPALNGYTLDNDDLWVDGLMLVSGVVNPNIGGWRTTKDFQKINKGFFYSNLEIGGSSGFVIYDGSFSITRVIENKGTPDGSLEWQGEFLENEKFVKFSRRIVREMAFYINQEAHSVTITDKVFIKKENLSDELSTSLNKYDLKNYPIDTNFVSELTMSSVDDISIWGSGFYNDSGIVSASLNWLYSKKKYYIPKGSYIINVNLNGNARALILNLDGTVRKSLVPGAGYNQTFNEEIDEDCYFITSQNITTNPDRPTPIRISVLNKNVVYDTAVTVSAFNSYLPTSLNTRKIYKDTYRPKVKRPIVTLISDDGRIQNDDWYIPLLDEFGVKSTFAIVGNWTREADLGIRTNTMKSNRLRELFYDGHDIASHTWTHKSDWGSVLTLEEIEEEMSRTKVFLEKITSTPVNMFVSPYGIRNANIDNVISKYYDANFISGYGSLNAVPLDNYFLTRVGFDTSETTYENKWDTVLKPAIDEAKAQNNWLIFAIHPQYTQYFSSNPDYLSRRDELRTLLQYCQDNDIEVTTAKKGYEYYKNFVNIGVRRYDSNVYQLGMDGTEYNLNYFE